MGVGVSVGGKVAMGWPNHNIIMYLMIQRGIPMSQHQNQLFLDVL